MSRRKIGQGWAILTAILAALLAKAFAVDAAVVEGRSMLPLLRPGSVVVVLRCAFGLRLPWSEGYLLRWGAPRRGDIVAATNPRDGLAIVKRVAAAGPSSLSVVAGRLLGPGIDYPLSPESQRLFGERLDLAAGESFLIGDNPAESVDSRDYGPVPIEAVMGRVLLFAGWAKE